jgi:putative ABC transport system ATP-binding protein
MEQPVIEVRDLFKSLGSGARTLQILRGISFTVPSGQFVAVIGASGSGKSTLLGLLAGLDDATGGSIRLDGAEICGMPESKLAQLRGSKIGFVFQSYQLVPNLTALENVMLAQELNSAATPHDAAARAKSMLARVGLEDRLDHYPVQLSGGEQQRVALARAFVMRPAIVLADEPTGNLDSKTGDRVLELLAELNREQGTTLLVVTHDPAIAGRAERRIELRDGIIAADDGAR